MMITIKTAAIITCDWGECEATLIEMQVLKELIYMQSCVRGDKEGIQIEPPERGSLIFRVFGGWITLRPDSILRIRFDKTRNLYYER